MGGETRGENREKTKGNEGKTQKKTWKNQRKWGKTEKKKTRKVMGNRGKDHGLCLGNKWFHRFLQRRTQENPRFLPKKHPGFQDAFWGSRWSQMGQRGAGGVDLFYTGLNGLVKGRCSRNRSLRCFVLTHFAMSERFSLSSQEERLERDFGIAGALRTRCKGSKLES